MWLLKMILYAIRVQYPVFFQYQFFQLSTQRFPKCLPCLDWYSRGDFLTLIKSTLTIYLNVSFPYRIWRRFLRRYLHDVMSFLLNLYKEANLNLMKHGINELRICPVAKINRGFFSKQIYIKVQSTAIAQ